MSDSNRTKIGYVKEVTYAVTPASPAIRNLRVKGVPLAFTPQTVESAELRSDRMLADLIRVGYESGGSLPLEVSWGNFDDLLEPAFQSAWQRTPVRYNSAGADTQITDVTVTTGVYTILTAAGTASDVNAGTFAVGHLVRASGFTNSANNGLYRASAATATSVTLGNTSVAETAPPATARLKVVGFRGASGDITATATGLGCTTLNFTTLGLIVGQWIKIGGETAVEQFATAALNNWARITAIAATALTLDNLPSGWTTDAGSAKTITVYMGDVLKNGTTEQTLSIEVQMQDLTTPEYDYYPGMAVDQFKIMMESQAIVEAEATFIGGGLPTNTTTRVSGATDVSAPTNDVLNTSSNVGVVADNNVALTGVSAVTSLELNFMNSLRRRNAVGSLSSVDIASGTFRCDGRMTMYYGSNTIRTKILAGTASSFYTRTVDTTAPVNKRAYIVDLPRIKFKAGDPQAPGLDTDRTMDVEFAALAHTTLGYQASFQRVEEYYQ